MGGWEGGDICVRMADSWCSTAETNSTLQSNYIPTTTKKKNQFPKSLKRQYRNHKPIYGWTNWFPIPSPETSFHHYLYTRMRFCWNRIFPLLQCQCQNKCHISEWRYTQRGVNEWASYNYAILFDFLKISGVYMCLCIYKVLVDPLKFITVTLWL